MSTVYNTALWDAVRERALERDGHRCTVGWLLGGPCSSPDVPLEAHHIIPVEEGGPAYELDNVGTTCKAHHPQWEALRRTIVNRRRPRVRCPHFHRSAEARRICERRLARDREIAA